MVLLLMTAIDSHQSQLIMNELSIHHSSSIYRFVSIEIDLGVQGNLQGPKSFPAAVDYTLRLSAARIQPSMWPKVTTSQIYQSKVIHF